MDVGADTTAAVDFTPDDERLHPPGRDEFWQESVALAWGDMGVGVGGFLRLGHSPHLGGGEISVWCHVFTPDRVYGVSRDHARRDTDVTERRLAAGTVASYEFDGANTRWCYDHDDVFVELTSEPHHLPVGLWPRSGSDYGKDIGTGHFEVANTVTGTLRVQGATYDVAGVGHRDHSWGVRHWDKRRSHRWVNGIFGPDLSFCLLTYHGEPAQIGRFGYVVRDNVVEHARDVDIVVHMEPDGATHRGGTARVTLHSGETLEFAAEPLSKGCYAYRRESALFESLCRITYGDRVGFGDFEISENPRNGRERPTALVNAIEDDGLYPVADD